MSLSFPQSISLTARKQMNTTTESVANSAPQAFLGSGSLYLDMTCSYITESRVERETLADYRRPWVAYDWMTEIGLAAFVAKRVEQPKHSGYNTLQNTNFLADSTTAYELQTAQDEIPSCAGQAIGEWLTTGKLGCGPSLGSVSFEPVDPFQKDEFTSGRVEYKRIMLGDLADYSATFINLTTEEFTAFVLWYRCQMLAGRNDFDASWLVHREFGAWHGHWAEPWTATFNNGLWHLSIKLILVSDEDNEAWALWEYEDFRIELDEFQSWMCQSLDNSAMNKCYLSVKLGEMQALEAAFCGELNNSIKNGCN